MPVYSCILRIDLLGFAENEAHIVQSMEPLEAFSHRVESLPLEKLDALGDANIAIVKLPENDVANWARQAIQAKKDNTKLVLIAPSNSFELLNSYLDQLEDVWYSPISEDELRYRLGHLLQQIKLEADLWQVNQYLDVTIDSIPSLVWYKTKDGVHEKVNEGFCATVGKTKSQVQGQHHAYIWDVEEDDPACIASENIVMSSGKTCVSEEQVMVGEEPHLLTTYKSPLYNIDGEVMGTVGVGIDVTQERAYEQDLIEKNHTLETIFTSLDCGVLIHSLDGTRILGVNQSALDILGYSSKEDLMNGGFSWIAPTVVESDRERLISAITQLEHVGDSVSTQYRVQHEDGRIVHVMGDLKMVEKDGERYIQRFLLDITDQKHTEEQRERNQRSLIQALSSDYVVAMAFNLDDETGELLRIDTVYDAALEGIFDENITLREAVNAYIEARVEEDERDMMRQLLSPDNIRNELSTKRRFDHLYRVRREERDSYRQVSVVSVEGVGKGSQVVIGFRNVDQQIRDELEKKILLEKALSDANRASQAKSLFLLNMSHDIRTPMNAILGFTTLAYNHLDQPEKMEEYFDKIKTSSNHLLSLINDVLDMSRIEQGKVTLEEDTCDLDDVMQELNALLQSQAEDKGLTLKIDASDVQHPLVVADRLKLNQILLNLTSNSLKFTPGGGTITVSVKERKGVSVNQGSYVFAVEDTGIGMSQEFIGHIFDPFERENSETINGIQGTGLGMAIVKNLVDMMKGKVEVSSVVGEGTKIVATIPLRFAHAESLAPTEQAQPGSSLGAINAQNYRVLLVDDNPLNREIAYELLTGVGFSVEVAENGQKAVDAVVEASDDHFDLVLMDIQMPVMNGYEAARAIRALNDERKSNIPILAVTADAFSEDRQRALEAGMNGHLPKPIDVDKLYEAMGSLLSS